MARWRGIALVLIVLCIGLPLTMPFLGLLTASFSPLFLTFQLIAGTLVLALPAGLAAAVLLYRTNLPGRQFFRFITVLTLFVPLPVLTTAWQVALGSLGWWTPQGRPWAEGMGPAIWIHAQAAWPWVVLICGQGLLWVEPELEEDALLATGPWRVLWAVTLPRSRGAIAAAAIWIALQVNGEVAVADLMLVNTHAREIYNEFALGGGDALTRAILAALPVTAFLSVAVYWTLGRLDAILPPLAALAVPPRPFALGRLRSPAFGLAVSFIGMVTAVPLGSLIYRTGWVGNPPEWSAAALADRMLLTLRGDAALFRDSLATMFMSAAVIASAALALCWLARTSTGFRRILFALIALAWCVPGPIMGLGLHRLIIELVVWIPFPPLATALHYGPSPLPVLWAHLLRFLPCAVVALWPVSRLIPRELSDSMQLDGATPSQELQLLIWPLLRRAWLAVVVIIAALALGEVGAIGMQVETPGWLMFAHVLFDRMHYGQAHDVTALCLALLTIVAVLGAIAWIGTRVWSGRNSIVSAGPAEPPC